MTQHSAQSQHLSPQPSSLAQERPNTAKRRSDGDPVLRQDRAGARPTGKRVFSGPGGYCSNIGRSQAQHCHDAIQPFPTTTDSQTRPVAFFTHRLQSGKRRSHGVAVRRHGRASAGAKGCPPSVHLRPNHGQWHGQGPGKGFDWAGGTVRVRVRRIPRPNGQPGTAHGLGQIVRTGSRIQSVCPMPRKKGVAVLKGEIKGFPTPTETNLHGDALCFMVETWTRQKTTEALVLVVGGGWRLAVGGWWRLGVGVWWLVAVGSSWRLVVGGGCQGVVGGGRLAVGRWWPLGAVLKCCPKKKKEILRTALEKRCTRTSVGVQWPSAEWLHNAPFSQCPRWNFA